jgi:hypothetical protein
VLTLMERLFALLELALLVIFALALIPAGTIGDAFGFPWILLWLVALAGLVPGLGGLATRRLAIAGESFTGQGTVAAQSALTSVAVPVLVLIGVLALRAAVIFSAQ